MGKWLSRLRNKIEPVENAPQEHTATIWPGIVVRIYPRPRECVEAGHCVNFICDYYPLRPGWCRQRVSMR